MRKLLLLLLIVLIMANTSGSAVPVVLPDRALANQCIVLLHGLGRSSFSMARMARKLSAKGYKVVNQDYPSTDASIESLADTYVAQAVAQCQQFQPQAIHFVTHSLGGILIRQFLQNHHLPGTRIVMLSPPNQGSEVAQVLKDFFLFEWVMGPAAQQLGVDDESVPKKLQPIGAEVGVIMGNQSIEPWFSAMLPGDDDGKVSVASAKLAGMKDFLVIDSGHTFIMDRGDVLKQVDYFFRHGRFAKASFAETDIKKSDFPAFLDNR